MQSIKFNRNPVSMQVVWVFDYAYFEQLRLCLSPAAVLKHPDSIKSTKT